MKKFLIVILFLVVLGSGFVIGLLIETQKEKMKVEEKHSAYFIQSYFYTGIEDPDRVMALSEPVLGGISSHHFYAEREISNLFSSWRNQNPETIVIIGASHFDTGAASILVSQLPYETPWGLLENDEEKISFLISSGLAKEKEESFTREHSISVLAGFIKYYFPKAKLVPIITRKTAREEEMKDLAEALANFENVIVVASVDFSHHVDLVTAEAQDKETVELIKNRDLEGIYNLSPSQLDNPPALVAFLEYLEIKNAQELGFYNTNQARLSGNLDSSDVTSYIFASFGK